VEDQGFESQAAFCMQVTKATQSASAVHAVCTSVWQLDDLDWAQVLQVVSGLAGVAAQSVELHCVLLLEVLQRQVTSEPMYVSAPVECAVSQHETQSS
jgi:hypothetical protein